MYQCIVDLSRNDYLSILWNLCQRKKWTPWYGNTSWYSRLFSLYLIHVRVCLFVCVASVWEIEIFLLFFFLTTEWERERSSIVVRRWWWLSIVVSTWSNCSSYMNVLSLCSFFLLLYRCCFYSELNYFMTTWNVKENTIYHK